MGRVAVCPLVDKLMGQAAVRNLQLGAEIDRYRPEQVAVRWLV